MVAMVLFDAHEFNTTVHTDHLRVQTQPDREEAEQPQELTDQVVARALVGGRLSSPWFPSSRSSLARSSSDGVSGRIEKKRSPQSQPPRNCRLAS